jgi:membrane-bound ClpP family serine protease
MERGEYGERHMCHILLMMPILGLPLFWFLDFSVALPLYLGILALSGVVMLLTVQSVRQPPSSGIEGMRGDLAEVVEPIRSRGKVRYHNELWFAEAREPIDIGETVRIIGNQGLRLLVEKSSSTPNTAAPQHCGWLKHIHRR